jgi:hypothetical protein
MVCRDPSVAAQLPGANRRLTFGIDNDCTDCTVGASSLVDQLDRAHKSWPAHMQL